VGGSGAGAQGQGKKCKAYLCFHAKVKNGRGLVARECNRTPCHFDHPPAGISGYTQTEAIEAASVVSRDTVLDANILAFARSVSHPWKAAAVA
jgi:hypothetical protein